MCNLQFCKNSVSLGGLVSMGKLGSSVHFDFFGFKCTHTRTRSHGNTTENVQVNIINLAAESYFDEKCDIDNNTPSILNCHSRR